MSNKRNRTPYGPRQPWPGETAAVSFVPPADSPYPRISQKAWDYALLYPLSANTEVVLDIELRQRITTLEAAARAVCEAWGVDKLGSLGAAIEDLGRLISERNE